MNPMIQVSVALLALTGTAAADAHKEAKKAPDATKVAVPKAKPEAPKPPAEVADLAKQLAGTYKCKGDEFGPEGAKSPVTVTNKIKLDPDKYWVTDTLDIAGAMKWKMQSFTTYDATAKKWRRVSVNNMGGYMVGTSDGLKDGKLSWTLDMFGPMPGMFRDHLDVTDPKAPKAWGELSVDKGKTWNKMYEITCKK